MVRSFCLLTKVFGAVALIVLTSSPALALSFPAAKTKDGSPDRRRGAGSRNAGCVAGQTDEERARTLFAILPQANESLTTSAHPDFFWYTPPLTTPAEMTFILQEVGGNEDIVYRSVFRSNQKEGIARFSLPSGIGGASLEIGKQYVWSVALNCFPDEDSEQSPLVLKSGIQRIAPSESLESQLKVASSLGQAEVFAQNGLWNESLSALADSQCDATTRDQGLAAWSDLFKSVELDYFTQVPMLGDCACDCK